MRKLIILIALIGVVGCASRASDHRNGDWTRNTEFTLGLVQREIKPGMSQADVASSLGSPNIVSKDGSGKEVWIYDKIASEASYKASRTSAGILGGVGGLAGSALLLGIPNLNYDSSESHSTTSDRTLTVVIKFDGKSLVRDATYHSSEF